MAKNENNFRTSLTKALIKSYGKAIYIQKNHGNQFSAGLVDMEIVLAGNVRFLELKATGDGEDTFDWKQLTALQHNTLRAIHYAGGVCGVLVYFKDAQMAVWCHFRLADAMFKARWRTSWDELQAAGAIVLHRSQILGGGFHFQNVMGIVKPA